MGRGCVGAACGAVALLLGCDASADTSPNVSVAVVLAGDPVGVNMSSKGALASAAGTLWVALAAALPSSVGAKTFA